MKPLYLFIILTIIISSCKDKKTDNPDNPLTDINNTKGYGLLNKVKGIWNGPVMSATALGSYPEWIVDFRPISASQVSAKNELDTLNDIHMSFFVALYNNEYRLAFRNGGSFGGLKRVSYFLADSVKEESGQSYYRFAEVIKGTQRAYTEVVFKQDSMILKSYTNKYNTQADPTLHMTWRARLQDSTSCAAAVAQFSYPQKTLAKDFSTTFTGQAEAVYFTLASDPYPESAQPYLGQSNITYSFSGAYTPNPTKNVFLIITTQPLISGFSLNLANYKYRSRYVILPSNKHNFTFNYMHPGTYYLYALYDNDGNQNISSGDWVSTTNTTFSLSAQGTGNAATQINFTIP